MIDENKSLPVMNILRSSFNNIVANIKTVFILSYAIALFVYLLSLFLPGPTTLPSEATVIARISYLALFVSMLLIISLSFYRLLTIDIRSYRDFVPHNLLAVITKMVLYIAGLLFLLFVAQLSVSLLFLLIASVVNNVGAASILNESNMPPVVYFTMLVVAILIVMRLQPTFISIATNSNLIPMKSSYYYTRGNNKELILIGLLSFIPAMVPITIVVYALSIKAGEFSTEPFVTFLTFPLFLLPYIAVLSAGVEVYKYLITNGQKSNELEI